MLSITKEYISEAKEWNINFPKGNTERKRIFKMKGPSVFTVFDLLLFLR